MRCSGLMERPRTGRELARRGGMLGLVLVCLGASAAFSEPARPAGGGAASAAGPGAARSALAGVRLWVNPASEARRQADAWRRARPADAAALDRIAAQPVAQWLGEWVRSPRAAVSATVGAAAAAGAVPVFAVYDIPGRDCGGYSGGGARGASDYRAFVRGVADGLGGRRAVVVLEPDALAGMSCLSGAGQDERVALIAEAIATLKARGATVYLDAGNPGWVSAPEMAARLRRAGIDQADGFALNVSNFFTTAQNLAYGRALSARVGGKHYVVDTSRNGAGAAGSPCNPPGRALGAAPTTLTGDALADAFLWIKSPGQSDGSCNGGPPAGQWWATYALGLARHGRG